MLVWITDTSYLWGCLYGLVWDGTKDSFLGLGRSNIVVSCYKGNVVVGAYNHTRDLWAISMISNTDGTLL